VRARGPIVRAGANKKADVDEPAERARSRRLTLRRAPRQMPRCPSS